MESYVSPSCDISVFNCPFCGVYSHHTKLYLNNSSNVNSTPEGYFLMVCQNCNNIAILHDEKLIYPFCGEAPLANSNMPEDVKKDYEDARRILNTSPNSAVTCLISAIQKLCICLGGKSENINVDIAFLVKNVLPEKFRKAFDSIGVSGNNSVYPGQIYLHDDMETAGKMFVFINIICDNLITISKEIDKVYDEKVPEMSKKR